MRICNHRSLKSLLGALAVVLLTLLGAAGEKVSMDRHLKANKMKTRTHSLIF